MTVILIDPHHPVLPAEFLNATLGRHETVEVDDGVEIDVTTWGIVTAIGAPWFLTARADAARKRQAAGEMLIDARLTHVAEAVAVMQRAVGMGEWEQNQTHDSLIPYLREESEEFIEAVNSGDDDQILKELGDVFLQVLFHAEIATRRGKFDFGDVAASFVSKMRSRSPYLFDGTSETMRAEEQERLWAEGKVREQTI